MLQILVHGEQMEVAFIQNFCPVWVISFFLDVSPIWLLQEKTTGKDRTGDSYRGYREELALGKV